MEDQPAENFFSQLQRRKVFRVCVAYAVVSFVLIQIGDATFDSLPLPQPAMLWMLAAMFLLFPVVVTVAWLFEITPRGVVFDRRFARLPRAVEGTFIATITVVSMTIAGWLVWSGQDSRPLRTTLRGGVPTIAVLPFNDYSPAGNAAYLSNGIAEQLLTVLNRLAEFNLVGRTSSFYWGSRGLDLKDVADRLGADHIVEGSVQLHDSRVLITAQLIETGSMLHVWSQSYERSLDDLIDLELEIARSIADSMRVVLSGASQVALEDHATRDSQAYVLYLQGREYLRRPAERQTLEIAESLFLRALAEDPAMAAASVGLCQARLALYRVTELTDAYQTALTTCLRIAGQAPRSADAYTALGDLHRMVGNFSDAEAMFRAAIEQDPEAMEAHHGLARALQGQGRLEEAEGLFQRIIRMEPAYWGGYRGYGLFLARQGRFAEAAAQFQRATELTPDDGNAFSNLGLAHFEAGDWIEARAAWDHALSLTRTEPVLYNLATLSYYQGDYAGALLLLNEIISGGNADFRSYGKLGACHRQLGNQEAARQAFQRAVELAQERLRVVEDGAWIKAYLASYHASLGDSDQARRYLDAARAEAPDAAEVNYFAAVVEALSGGPDLPAAIARAIETGYPRRLIEADPLFDAAAVQ